jgi:hypothetical protein
MGCGFVLNELGLDWFVCPPEIGYKVIILDMIEFGEKCMYLLWS